MGSDGRRVRGRRGGDREASECGEREASEWRGNTGNAKVFVTCQVFFVKTFNVIHSGTEGVSPKVSFSLHVVARLGS